MNWSKETTDALHAWLAPSTSRKHHPIDDARYFLFIGHVWRDYHSLWDEGVARDRIKHKAKELHPEWDVDFLEEFVEERRSKGTEILDFLCVLKDKGKLNELISV